jgi:hypothetical protein
MVKYTHRAYRNPGPSGGHASHDRVYHILTFVYKLLVIFHKVIAENSYCFTGKTTCISYGTFTMLLLSIFLKNLRGTTYET